MTSPDPFADYDLFDPAFIANPFAAMSEIRESQCPVAHSDRWGGSWLPTRYEDIVAVAQDPSLFSSRQIFVVPPPPRDVSVGPYGALRTPPITSDPPAHHQQRRIILPTFAPHAIAKYEPTIRELCHALIDGFVDRGEADAAEEYAKQIPVRVIAAVLGVPLDMADQFTSWVRGVVEVGLADPKVRVENQTRIGEFFRGEMQDRRAMPREDDFITELVQTRLDGELVSDDFVLGVCNLMLLAGVDTTWSAIGSSLWHLAQFPAQRTQLREQPDLWSTAIEELLRVYAPVTMARMVQRDSEFQGCPMQRGDRVILSFPAANRDPRQFSQPDQVQLDREDNRHIAFGAGIHRCAGSNLARLELRVALQTWLERIPEFQLIEPTSIGWLGPQVRGPRNCPVRF